MKPLTVFTPTYNRAYCLDQCYQSLTRQTTNQFIWLIIDDGSTDDTAELVKEWRAENRIEIQYVYQENQGMHGAHNTAYDRIETELNVCIDSDDYMPDDAIEKILTFWHQFGNDSVSGIIGLDADQDGRIIGTEMPGHLKRSTLYDLYQQHKVTGDKKLVYRTSLTKQYPYPIFAGEKYVGLDYKYHMLSKDYDMLVMNEVLCMVEYLPDGSSLNMMNQYRSNPRGFIFYRKELMKLPFVSPTFKYRQAIHYVSSNLLLKNFSFLKETPDKRLTLAAIPFGLVLYLLITVKTRMA